MKCVNIKLWDILSCFHYISNAPRTYIIRQMTCYFCLVLLCFHARLFVDALWSRTWKGLTSWLSFVMSNCEVVTFRLVSWVGCGA